MINLFFKIGYKSRPLWAAFFLLVVFETKNIACRCKWKKIKELMPPKSLGF